MPRDFPRSRRIEDQIQRILSDLIRSELRDPRLADVFITAVRVSRDLSVAWVYYSVLQLSEDSGDRDAAFAHAAGFLRSRLAKQLTMRRVPDLRFAYDETGSQARRMDRLIDEAVKQPANSGEPSAQADSESDDSI